MAWNMGVKDLLFKFCFLSYYGFSIFRLVFFDFPVSTCQPLFHPNPWNNSCQQYLLRIKLGWNQSSAFYQPEFVPCSSGSSPTMHHHKNTETLSKREDQLILFRQHNLYINSFFTKPLSCLCMILLVFHTTLFSRKVERRYTRGQANSSFILLFSLWLVFSF